MKNPSHLKVELRTSAVKKIRKHISEIVKFTLVVKEILKWTRKY